MIGSISQSSTKAILLNLRTAETVSEPTPAPLLSSFAGFYDTSKRLAMNSAILEGVMNWPSSPFLLGSSFAFASNLRESISAIVSSVSTALILFSLKSLSSQMERTLAVTWGPTDTECHKLSGYVTGWSKWAGRRQKKPLRIVQELARLPGWCRGMPPFESWWRVRSGLELFGGASRVRTVDLRIKSPLLYQLS